MGLKRKGMAQDVRLSIQFIQRPRFLQRPEESFGRIPRIITQQQTGLV